MKRIIMDVNEEEAKKIDDLVSICGLKTRTTFIKDAITAFAWLIKQRRLGRKIFAKKDDEDLIVELESPSLRTASFQKLKSDED